MMSINQSQIKPILLNLLSRIAPEADLTQLGEHENIRETLGIDSYDFLNFMIGINEELAIEIPETDYGKLLTLTDVIRYIETHV